MKRKVIEINEEKCNGCGLCLPNCPEGALQLIAGKARLVSDLFCDGLGACIGYCPQGAISVVEREAEPYDERRVMANIVRQGSEVIAAHLRHLEEHGEIGYLRQALAYLKEKGVKNPLEKTKRPTGEETMAYGCPGSLVLDLRETGPKEKRRQEEDKETTEERAYHASFAGSTSPFDSFSELRQWPVQLFLVSPLAPYFQQADVLLVADCVAYALNGFHERFLRGRSIAIACPKLDKSLEAYEEKLLALIDEAKIKSLTVMMMQVPCCRGLLYLAEQALSRARRKIPLRSVIVSIDGKILEDSFLRKVAEEIDSPE